MKTVQKYGEGADHASPIEDSAVTPPQSDQNATPTVELLHEQPPLPANSFTFDELASFSELANEGKVIICSLLEAGRYEPDQISRALDLLSHSPTITSIEDEALQAVLADPAALPPFRLEEATGESYEPIVIELPYFLRQQIRDVDHTKRLLAAIELAFYEFSRSKAGCKIDEDVNQMVAYSALRFNFIEIIEKASRQLGTYEKPRASEFLFEAPPLATEGSLIPSFEVIDKEPMACTDIDELQEWISTLQRMARLQLKVIANHERIEANSVLQIQSLEEIKSIQEGLIAAQKSQLDAYKAKEVETKQEEDKPDQSSHIELPVFISDGYDSEIEIMRLALVKAAETKFDEILESVCNGETEEAFFHKEEYDTIQNMIDRLSAYVAILSGENHSSLQYHQDKRQYLHAKTYKRNKQMERKAAFIDAYSTVESDEDQDQPTTTQE